jgi:hypothetical protein
MKYLTDVEQRAFQGVEVTLPGPDNRPKICPQAESFAAVCGTLLHEVGAYPSDVRMSLTLLTLQFKFFWSYEHASADCQSFVCSPKGVKCLFDLYRETYLKLFDIDLKLRPPRFQEPPPPPASPTKVTKVYKIDKFSFPIGEVEDNDVVE